MGDAENALPPSKKRAAGRELSRDNPGLDDEEDSSELESGTFKKASDEVLATRRIVKVRRSQTTSAPSANPFAGIRLVPSTEPSVTVTPANTEPTETVTPANTEPTETVTPANTEPTETVTPASNVPLASSENKFSKDSNYDACKELEKEVDENSKLSESKIDEPVAAVDASSEPEKDGDESSKQSESKNVPASVDAADKEDKENGAAVDGAAELEVDNGKTAGVDKPENEDEKDASCENADSSRLSSFGQLSSTQNAFTGLAGTGFSTSTFSFGAIPKDGSALNFSSGSVFGQVNNGSSSSSLFISPGTSIAPKSEGTTFPSMQEVVVETGEENEKVVFSADSVLFEFFDGVWKERGKGELKVNVSQTVTERARLLMRARGNYRLILNASLYPDMKLTNMEKKGVTFACINSAGEGKDGLSTFALRFKDPSIVEEFRAVVAAHKGKSTAVSKTPENSPKATDD